ncbi:hypothetical protein HYH03_010244 [Edaphochlamys debaryana]|uniref:ubiquitinyl hydrolase 1 n=1 Tax=Edaphochlamys debaryana TaxID=47281 RepID=A0A836BXQ2_9CHLO|nr:hypothetical protein HYH03_010244 [Edaphochlamys debaryana]|eukprot:KAG2491458.1 hypothetical protein HYH03_010244 [Edaphochlamys debaryana]
MLALQQLGKEVVYVSTDARDAAPSASRGPHEAPGTAPDSGTSAQPTTSSVGGSSSSSSQRPRLGFELLQRPDLWALVINAGPEPPSSLAGRLAAALGISGRHWLALKRFGGVWYILDSKLPRPQPLASDQEALALLQRAVVERAATVLAVTEAAAAAAAAAEGTAATSGGPQ